MEFENKADADRALMEKGPNDRETYEAYTRFYERQYANQTFTPSNGSTTLERLGEEMGQQPATPQDQPQEGGATLLQDENIKTEQTNHEVRQLLEAELGSDWENVARDAFDQVQAIGRKYGLSIDQLNDMAHDVGIASNARMQADLIRKLANRK